MKNRYFVLGVVVFLLIIINACNWALQETELSSPTSWQCGDDLIYERKVYQTVQIGDQCWMAENLNVGMIAFNTNEQIDDGMIRKICINGDDDCAKSGGYYLWAEAMNYQFDSPRGICPNGWHIPTKAEFEELIQAANDNPDNLIAFKDTLPKPNRLGFYGDLTGFISVRPDSFSFQRGQRGLYWSSTDSDSIPILLQIDYINTPDSVLVVSDQVTNVGGFNRKSNAVCVRCVKD